MRKKILSLSLILIVGFTACKKEVNDPALTPEVATAKPGGPSSPPSILQWQKAYGSTANELGFDIVKTSDGDSYVFAGSTTGNNGDVSGNHGIADAWIVKVNLTGTITWQKTIGGSGADNAYDIEATTDGGFIIAGAAGSNDGDLTETPYHGNYDAWIIKLSSDGNIQWQKVLGGTGTDRAKSVIQTANGEYMVSGYTSSTDSDVTNNHGDYDAWVIKLDGSGNMIWQKTFGGSLYDAAGYLTEVSDGYMICATTASSNGDLAGLINREGRDFWLYKINSNGDLLWQKTYGGSGTEDGSFGIRSTTDGGYVFSTSTTSNNGDVSGYKGYRDAWVVKINSSGNIVWQKCFGGSDADDAVITDINTAGQIILVGLTFSRNGDITGFKGGSDFWVLRLDANGNKLNSNVLGGKSADSGSGAIVTPDNMYMGIGRTESNNGDVTGNHGGSDVWMVKFKF